MEASHEVIVPRKVCVVVVHTYNTELRHYSHRSENLVRSVNQSPQYLSCPPCSYRVSSNFPTRLLMKPQRCKSTTILWYFGQSLLE